MIFKISKDINFFNLYKKMNIFSITLIVLSFIVISFKGLNFGVDFRGGTLIELRTENKNVAISEITQSLLKMNLGDVSVKKFGTQNDYLIKIQSSNNARY